MNFKSNYCFDLPVVSNSERLHSKASLLKTKKVYKDQKIFACALRKGLSNITMSTSWFYLVALLKRDTTMGVFQGVFRLFIGRTAFSQNSSKKQLVKIFICLVSQIIVVLTGLRQGNCRNVIVQIL